MKYSKHLPILFIALISTSCANIRTSQTPLPTAKFMKARTTATITKTSVSNISIINPGEKNQDPVLCFMNVSAWGTQHAKKEDLVQSLVQEASKLNADYLYLGDFKSQIAGSISQHIGYGIVTNNPVYQNYLGGTACIKSEVTLGIVHEKGKIQYVQKNSLAEKQGMKEGMQIIAVNGRAIASDEFTMQIEINAKSKGDQTNVEIIDLKGNKKSFDFKLE